MNKGTVHIVCLDAPSPPDYGGVYDLYYKIPALAKLGYGVVLHYFDYKNGRGADGLEPFCKAVYRYPRKSFWRSLFSSVPYIVHSRINHDLIKNLNEDSAPVILEGIHCTGILPYINKGGRNLLVRIHNNEAIYYRHLVNTEEGFFKKQYLKRESRLLCKYQSNLNADLHYCFLSLTDKSIYEEQYKVENSSFIPAFIPWYKIKGKPGRGQYCMYHGNLTVSENVKAAKWLVKNVFADLDHPLLIAGKAPDNHLVNFLKKYSNVKLVSDPSEEQLNKLMRDAQIHLLPSFNKTGVKLKLLNAVYNGRFCITNTEGVEGSGVTGGVLLANDANEYKDLIDSYMNIDFTMEHIEEREYLTDLYNNETSAQKLSAFL